MTGNELATAYLDLVRRNGDRPSALLGPIAEVKELEAFFKGRYLPCPMFLTAPEHAQLTQDLTNLRSALVSLPDRLFGGDLAAFARAVGMTEPQADMAARGRAAEVTRFARADVLAVPGGFKVVEFNMGSALGGLDIAELARAMVRHPTLAGFAADHGLEFTDTRVEVLHTMFAETGVAQDTDPFVAIVDSPGSFAGLGEYLQRAAETWDEKYGIRAGACHLGDLEYRDGAVWLRGQRVDVVYRTFILENLVTRPHEIEVMAPLMAAAERGEVRVFTPLDAEAFASKNALAMVADGANRALFTPEEQVSLGRLLPWTRILADGEATLETGETVDLVEYALKNRGDLVLKPTLMHGGIGVVLGSDPHVTQEYWEQQIRQSLDGTFTVQRLIRPEPDYFPTEDGELDPYTVMWGVFTVTRGYGGMFGRATRNTGSTTGVISMATGAMAVACLHATR
ncbi:hypothetical protein GCM10009839_07280 [Catenulispora yoronensis]|uniref:Circularly permuted ATPgrasp domain-containing protein n=1 Tax=Catenulispora yoronensis TaxID=450799 RepID=A0ABP5F4W0_9ACTN